MAKKGRQLSAQLKSQTQEIPKEAGRPATFGMVDKTRRELKSDIASLRLEMRSGFNSVDGRFKVLDAKFKGIDARFDRMEARFKDIDARFDGMEARFKDIDARFDRMEARFKDIDARFDGMEAKLADMDARINRILAIVEEMRAENRFAMDQLALMQKHFEEREAQRKREMDEWKKESDAKWRELYARDSMIFSDVRMIKDSLKLN